MSELTNHLTEQGTTPTEEERNRRSGRDIPGGTGVVSDEDVDAISESVNADEGQTGEDHSTDVRGREMPNPIGGSVQDANDRTSDIARIKE